MGKLNVVLIYGFLESASGDGGGLAEVADVLRTRYGADITICTWADEKLTDTATYLQLGVAFVQSVPLLVIGFSFGGCAAVEFAGQMDLRNLVVDSLVLLDPVPTSLPARLDPKGFSIPLNVAKSHCLWRGFGHYPLSHPIHNPEDQRNELVDCNHGDVGSQDRVRRYIYGEAARLTTALPLPVAPTEDTTA